MHKQSIDREGNEKMPQSKRILVAGGAGFIGSHLCDRLVETGHEVICLDNFSTGRRENIAHLVGNSRFRLILHDVEHPLRLKVDQIYNLACPASPPQYQRDPMKTIKTSVLGSINLLELAEKVRARILLASTSEVYGDPEVHPQPEDYRGNVSSTGPRACYDEGKRCAETLFFDYRRQKDVDTRVVRIFNTYGPRMQPGDGRVVSNFIVQSLAGQDLTVYGDGSQSRSFCYVSDMVEGLVRVMNWPGDFPGPVNLGNPVEIPILELAEKIIKLTGSGSRIVFRPLPRDDPRRRRPDITLARTKYGWEPGVSLEEGLSLTAEYFKTLPITGKKAEAGRLPKPAHRDNPYKQASPGDPAT